MIVPVMAISNLVLTRQIYSEETNGAHAHNRDRVPLICPISNCVYVNLSYFEFCIHGSSEPKYSYWWFICFLVTNCTSGLTVLRLLLQSDDHPRRPRGSQTVWEKRRDESCQARAEEPQGTDSHQTISKRSSKCWLLIGHKKGIVLLCAIGDQQLLGPFHEVVPDGYCLTNTFPVSSPRLCVQGNFHFLLS